ASQNSYRSKRQAIDILESLNRRQLLTTGEQVLLAQLYEATGDWVKARAQLTSTLTATAEQWEKGGNRKDLEASYPNYLVYACDCFLKHEDPNAAGLWLARLEKLRPDSFATLALRAR